MMIPGTFLLLFDSYDTVDHWLSWLVFCIWGPEQGVEDIASRQGCGDMAYAMR